MTRSLLVFCPGHPLTLDALMPRAALAAAAGGLIDAGHDTHVMDFATLEALDGPGAVPLRALFAAPPAHGSGPRAARRGRALFSQAVEALESARVGTVVSAISAQRCVDFVVYEAAALADIRMLCRAVEALRHRQPRLPQFALGEAIHAWGPAVLESCPGIDALIDGDPESTVSALAGRIAAGRPWRDVPNLVLREGGAIRHTPVEADAALDGLPAPCYSAAVYPALRGSGKLRVWPVEDSRGGDLGGFGAARPPLEQRQVRTRDAEAVCAEIDRLARDHGARTLYFPGECTPAAHLDALSYALLARCIYMQYARRGHIRQTDPLTASTLYVSGCQAVDFRIDTGSQRLMHDFYGHPFCVTEVEQVLGACRQAGIFTATRFTYPCPEDDYHTEMETLRLVRRARPSAISLGYPALLPGSAWRASARDFGFKARPVFRGGAVPWALHAPAPPPLRTMGAAQVMRAAAGMRSCLAEEGYAGPVSALEALVARVCGAYGEEASFAARLREAIATLDSAAAQETLGHFNGKATAPRNTIAFPRAIPVRAVVGN